MNMPARKYLVFGAHPDDPDELFGGCAIKLSRLGHLVKFVSTTNGDAGHHLMKPADLAKRRYAEAQASAKIGGISEYQILDLHDGQLEASLENRALIVKIIREFAPDVVISHRTCDYHADHRATAQLVQDASFLIRVPLYCRETPVPESSPVFCSAWDDFKLPAPFRADIAIAVDDVATTKLAMLDCHVSQFYEWLPWLDGHRNFDATRMTQEEKFAFLEKRWLARDRHQADAFSPLLRQAYGPAADTIRYVESFELSEYGRQIDRKELSELFSMPLRP